MKIASSDVVMASSSSYSYQKTVEESLKLEVTKNPESRINPNSLAENRNLDLDVSISELARIFQQYEQSLTAPPPTTNVEQLSEEESSDPRVQLIKTLIEYMLGQNIKLFGGTRATCNQCESASNVAEERKPQVRSSRPSPQAWELEYHARTTVKESEQVQFQSSGVVRTSDNREIKFNLSFELQREFQQVSSTDIVASSAKKVDPLVLNFSASPLQLSDQQFSFDLDADGKKENISFVNGAGFLALDKNKNGKIDDGKELFGPQSGNGFGELQQYDIDHNGWIDENDPVYQQLQVWTKNATGKDHLASLKEAHVGALFLGNVNTSFSMNDTQNKPLAQLRSSGLWLSEAGQAHSLQQIDLVA
ncbi:VCBS repeat-containing protein [Undibacterium sp. LX40W]|uniref:VCBS repeat-containing protein n=1 Tax=Undibacterium nitidum TaxID=2762298 RepID=A0A923HN26_9BURK|nr:MULTISPECIES: VCBS repeat-containing protein [Undibacterium]MBC3880703.1 VCBS repeat-containing protein [Undibacterium nitidum]MBC3890562.1 VCBS repeat-containing protein [Undibacterium sp. LX40W]